MHVRRTLAFCAQLLCLGGVSASLVEAQGQRSSLDARAVVAQLPVQDSARAQPSRRSTARRITLDLHDAPLKDALRAIATQGDVVLFYNDRDLPTEQRVSVHVTETTVAEALRLVLRGTGLAARATAAGQWSVVRLISPPTRERAPDSTGAVRGTITDSATHAPVVGATVAVNGGEPRTVTGDDGAYRLAGVPAGPVTLVVRRLGYSPVSRPVTVVPDSETVVDVRLVPAPRMLDEVVTTATGDQARRQVGNVIATIPVDSLMRNAPVTNLSQVLTARVPGVQVFGTGGLTGAAPQINIRGQNSLSLSNQPLLYIDGVRVENSAAGAPTATRFAGATSGRFNDLDLSEIESVEIVKGPSASTLYGTDAANGVILVRTKRGVAGAPRWHAFGEVGALSYDRDRFSPAYYAWGHSATSPSTSTRCTLLAAAAGSCIQDSVTAFSPLRDPETTPIGHGQRRAVGLQLSGGSGTRYFLAGSAEDEIGYLKMPAADAAIIRTQRGGARLSDEALHPNAIRKYSVRGNLAIPVARTAELNVHAGLVRQDGRIPDPGALSFGVASTGVRDANDGWFLNARAGDSFLARHREEVTHITGGVAGTWSPTPWLTGRLRTGLDFSSSYLDQLVRAGEGFAYQQFFGGVRDNTKTLITLSTIDAGITASAPLTSAITARTSLGVQYNRRVALTSTAAARQLAVGAQTVAGGAAPTVSEGTTESVVAGTYIEETLGFRDRLFLTGAVRADGSSAFGKGFRAAVYPKASLSWLLSEEPFWPSVPGLSSLRLRAAYGQSGIQPGPVAALASELLFPTFVDGVARTGADIGQLGNRELKPERQREIEAGLDAELLSGRVTLAATYYDKRSADALVNVPLQASFGGGTRWENVGAVRNRGYELALSARMLDRTILRVPVQWNVTLNGSLNDNTVLAVAPGLDAQYFVGRPSIVRGYPLYSYFQYPIVGVRDADGDGILDASDVTIGDSLTYLGRSYPRVQAAVTTDVSLWDSRVRLAATLDHRAGFSTFNNALLTRCGFFACRGAEDPAAPLAEQAAFIGYRGGLAHSTTAGFIEDASFTRLREVSLTYALPTSLLRGLHARDASLALAGRNIALWSSYSGADPEVQTVFGSSAFGAAFDQGGIPPATYWLLRLSIGF